MCIAIALPVDNTLRLCITVAVNGWPVNIYRVVTDAGSARPAGISNVVYLYVIMRYIAYFSDARAADVPYIVIHVSVPDYCSVTEDGHGP